MNFTRIPLKLFLNYFSNIIEKDFANRRFCQFYFKYTDKNIYKKIYIAKPYCTDRNSNFLPTETRKRKLTDNSTESSLSKYKVFKDFDSPVILDVDEERQARLEHPELFEEQQSQQMIDFADINLERGKTGVFEIEELVYVLKKDNAKNIAVIKIPPEYKYADYMVIITGRSNKHLYSMAEYVKKLFKRKRHENDRIPKIEGSTSKLGKYNDWLAMDLGNIVLHLFLQPVREKYDLETLWSVGVKYDDLTNQKEDQYITLLKQHTHASLQDLIPSEELTSENEQKLA